jgi:hypothetical protein
MANTLWRERIVWGMRWGARFAVVFGGFAALLFILDGPRSFREYGTSLQRVLAVYAVSGVVGGLILGLAKPILRYPAGSAVTGLLVGTCVGVAFAAFDHSLSWALWDLALPGMFALAGSLGGLAAYRRVKQLGRLP